MARLPLLQRLLEAGIADLRALLVRAQIPSATKLRRQADVPGQTWFDWMSGASEPWRAFSRLSEELGATPGQVLDAILLERERRKITLAATEVGASVDGSPEAQ